jgi:FkbM family methyltransferase
MQILEARGLKFMCRPETSDEKTFREVIEKKAYEKRDFQIEKDEFWLDLGGNVGAFTVLAASKGCTVATFEPDPLNVEMIRQNLKLNSLRASMHGAAVVHDDRPSAVLNLWPKGQSWRNSLVRNKRGTTGIEVPCVNFFKLAKPDACVKMDIEGAEISILEAWPKGFRTKKLVFEYSFDVDQSCARLRRILERLKAEYPNVRYSAQIDRIEKWDFFPPATMVHCW